VPPEGELKESEELKKNGLRNWRRIEPRECREEKSPGVGKASSGKEGEFSQKSGGKNNSKRKRLLIGGLPTPKVRSAAKLRFIQRGIKGVGRRGNSVVSGGNDYPLLEEHPVQIDGHGCRTRGAVIRKKKTEMPKRVRMQQEGASFKQ